MFGRNFLVICGATIIVCASILYVGASRSEESRSSISYTPTLHEISDLQGPGPNNRKLFSETSGWVAIDRWGGIWRASGPEGTLIQAFESTDLFYKVVAEIGKYTLSNYASYQGRQYAASPQGVSVHALYLPDSVRFDIPEEEWASHPKGGYVVIDREQNIISHRELDFQPFIISMSSDGAQIVVLQHDFENETSHIFVFDATSGEKNYDFRPDPGRPNAIAVSDGKVVLHTTNGYFGYEDKGKTTFLTIEYEGEISNRDNFGNPRSAGALSFSPDGSHLFLADAWGDDIHLYSDGELTTVPFNASVSDTSQIDHVTASFSPDSQTIGVAYLIDFGPETSGNGTSSGGYFSLDLYNVANPTAPVKVFTA